MKTGTKFAFMATLINGHKCVNTDNNQLFIYVRSFWADDGFAKLMLPNCIITAAEKSEKASLS